MGDEPVSIYAAENTIDATLMVQLLADAGIEARIASNALEAVSGEVPYQLISVPVWVRRPDAARALEVIREHQTRLQRN
ncbi:MAG: putative prokaryotic signal transducing protein [Planctomycetaceae bacterium]|nr:putative prokaryotic signal transducing protein [Planctomycetaceae bacterium]